MYPAPFFSFANRLVRVSFRPSEGGAAGKERGRGLEKARRKEARVDSAWRGCGPAASWYEQRKSHRGATASVSCALLEVIRLCACREGAREKASAPAFAPGEGLPRCRTPAGGCEMFRIPVPHLREQRSFVPRPGEPTTLATPDLPKPTFARLASAALFRESQGSACVLSQTGRAT